MDKDKNWKYLSLLIAVIFILSMVPIFLLCRYAHPYADEFTETIPAMNALASGKSVLAAAFGSMVNNYMTWQGTFTAKFLMAVNPFLYGEQYYWLGPVIVLAVYLAGHFYFLHVLTVRVCRSDIAGWIMTACLTALLGFNFMPYPVQGIYWYESSVYYFAIYGIGLVALGMSARILQTEGQKKAAVLTVISGILAFLTGGGSMQTGLGFLFAFAAVPVMGIICKSKNRWKTVIPFILFTAGLIISIIAPGNFVRGKDTFAGIGVFMTIYKSIHQALVYISEWSSLYMVSIFAGVFLPVCWMSAKKSAFSFSYPVIATIYLCGMFAAQFAPFFYTYDMVVPLRALNPVFFSFHLIMFMIMYYWCGWIQKRVLVDHSFTAEQTQRLHKAYFRLGVPLTVCAFVLGCVASDQMTYLTSVNAALSLVSGEAAEFDRQMDLREEIYLQNQGQDTDVKVDELTVKPYLLFFEDGDVMEDPARWINVGVSQHYRFRSVAKIPAEHE